MNQGVTRLFKMRGYQGVWGSVQDSNGSFPYISVESAISFEGFKGGGEALFEGF